jgi:serine/threonine-protein kinase RsbT
MSRIVLPIRGESDILKSRSEGRSMAQGLGFGLADQTRLATAISELTRNVIQHAGTGQCTILDTSDDETIRVKIVVEDSGAGIEDVDLALTDGFSSSGGMGAGLPGARRLVSAFSLKTGPTGTQIEMVLERSRPGR